MFTQLQHKVKVEDDLPEPVFPDDGVVIDFPELDIEVDLKQLGILAELAKESRDTGITQDIVDAINKHSLLSGTALLTLACESSTGQLFYPTLSTEGLLAGVAKKTKAFFAKLAEHFSVTYLKIKGGLDTHLGKTISAVKEAANSGTQLVLDHPIATLSAVAVLIGSVTTAIAVSRGTLGTADVQKVQAAFKSIRWPGWNVPKSGLPKGQEVSVPAAGAKTEVDAAEVSSVLKSIQGKLTGLWTATDSYRASVNDLGKRSWDAVAPVRNVALDAAAITIGLPYRAVEVINDRATSYYVKHVEANGVFTPTSLMAQGMVGLVARTTKWVDMLIMSAIGCLVYKAVNFVLAQVKKCLPKSLAAEL